MLAKICGRYAVSYPISTDRMTVDSRNGRKIKGRMH